MIWFACKKCGKVHGRADSLVGTMVFCECSFGNRVPWASTAEAPEIPVEEAAPPPPPPRPRPSLPTGHDPDGPPEPGFPRPAPRRREARRPNPAYCLNHDRASEHTCADCKCPFCSACVVALRGQTLCGPCKNFRIRGLSRPPRVTALAIVSLVVALVAGPLTFCLTNIGMNPAINQQGSVVLSIVMCLVGLIPPVGGLVLGWLALREIDTRPRTGGRSLALTGAVTSLVGVLWCLMVAVLSVWRQW
jgi:hypothetical protein